MVQSGNGSQAFSTPEDTLSSFFRMRYRHAEDPQRGSFKADGLESRAKEETLFRDEVRMRIQIFINRINKIGRGWPHFVCVCVFWTRQG